MKEVLGSLPEVITAYKNYNEMREIDLLGATHWHLLMAKGGSYAKTGGLVNRR